MAVVVDGGARGVRAPEGVRADQLVVAGKLRVEPARLLGIVRVADAEEIAFA